MCFLHNACFGPYLEANLLPLQVCLESQLQSQKLQIGCVCKLKIVHEVTLTHHLSSFIL